MEEKYELAMKPMTIGTLKNRIVMPPIATYQSTEDGQNHSLFYTIKQIYKDLETLSYMGFEVFLCCGERTKAGDWLLGAAGHRGDR